MPHPRSGTRFSLALGLLCAVAAAPLALVACSHDWDSYDPRGGASASGSGGVELDAGTGGGGPGGGTATGTATASAATGSGGGSIDAGPMPVLDGLVALYTFEEGQGSKVHDVSNVAPALDLTILEPSAVAWAPGMLVVDATTRIRSDGPASKVFERCQQTNEITLEAWFKPASLDLAGPARIVTSSVDTSNRNFQLGQEMGSLQARLRATSSDANGAPFMDSSVSLAQTKLTHLVFTRDASGVRHMYLNVAEVGSDMVAGDFSNWDTSYPLLMADEETGGRSWRGEMHRIAIYDRALSAAEVEQNHAAGP